MREAFPGIKSPFGTLLGLFRYRGPFGGYSGNSLTPALVADFRSDAYWYEVPAALSPYVTSSLYPAIVADFENDVYGS